MSELYAVKWSFLALLKLVRLAMLEICLHNSDKTSFCDTT